MKKGAIFFLIIVLSITIVISTSHAARKALLIGITDYENLPSSSTIGISDLRGPINDVNAVREGLITYYGFNENEIKTLINQDATFQNIKATFNRWLVEGTKPGDMVFFYFSGHGSIVPDQNGDEKDGYDEVLCPYDVVCMGGYNIILDDELSIWLRKLNGRKVTVILDSCYSGGNMRSIGDTVVSLLEETSATRSRFVSIRDYHPQPIATARSRGADIPQSVVFLTASREDELAQEIQRPTGFHGGFTFGLHQSMRASPTSTYKELFDRIIDVVKDSLNLPQDPQIIAVNRDISIEPAFGGVMPSPPVPSEQAGVQQVEQTKPPIIPPPPTIEIGEKVNLAVDDLEGFSPEDMRTLKERLSRLPIVKMVEPQAFFDRLVRGKKKNGRYEVRLVNGIGDVVELDPCAAIEEVVERINAHLEYAYMVKQLSRIHHPNPSFKVKAWVTDEKRRDFRLGEKIVFGVRSERACYIILINVDSKGNFHIIYPNQYHKSNFIPENTGIRIPDERISADEFELQFGPPAGEETVKVIATAQPLDLGSLGIGDFRQNFQTISGEEKATFVRGVVDYLNSGEIAWSEDTVVIRSHDDVQQ